MGLLKTMDSTNLLTQSASHFFFLDRDTIAQTVRYNKTDTHPSNFFFLLLFLSGLDRASPNYVIQDKKIQKVGGIHISSVRWGSVVCKNSQIPVYMYGISDTTSRKPRMKKRKSIKNVSRTTNDIQWSTCESSISYSIFLWL